MNLIDIPRRAHVCALKEEPFTEGMTYYSVLEEGARRDYCDRCWQQVKTSAPRTHWKSKVVMKKREGRQAVDLSGYALILLKEALGDDEAAEEAFVLALYLARKKKLLLRDEILKESGERFSLYEVAETEEMLGVKKLALSSLQTEKVQDQLAKKFATWTNP